MNNLNLVGTPREIGFQYGKYFAEQGINLSSTLPSGTKERKDYTESVKFLYKADYPAMVVELKWNKNVRTALSQIYEKEYPESIADYTGEILLVAINYDKKTKEHECIIESWEK